MYKNKHRCIRRGEFEDVIFFLKAREFKLTVQKRSRPRKGVLGLAHMYDTSAHANAGAGNQMENLFQLFAPGLRCASLRGFFFAFPYAFAPSGVY